MKQFAWNNGPFPFHYPRNSGPFPYRISHPHPQMSRRQSSPQFYHYRHRYPEEVPPGKFNHVPPARLPPTVGPTVVAKSYSDQSYYDDNGTKSPPVDCQPTEHAQPLSEEMNTNERGTPTCSDPELNPPHSDVIHPLSTETMTPLVSCTQIASNVDSASTPFPAVVPESKSLDPTDHNLSHNCDYTDDLHTDPPAITEPTIPTHLAHSNFLVTPEDFDSLPSTTLSYHCEFKNDSTGPCSDELNTAAPSSLVPNETPHPSDGSSNSDNQLTCPSGSLSQSNCFTTGTALSNDSYSATVAVSPSAIECSEEEQCSVQTPTSHQLPQADSLPTTDFTSDYYQMSTVEGSPLETAEGTWSPVNDVHSPTHMERPGADYVPADLSTSSEDCPPSADEWKWRNNIQSPTDQQFPQANYLLTDDSPSIKHYQMSTVEGSPIETVEGAWNNVNNMYTPTTVELPTVTSPASENCASTSPTIPPPADEQSWSNIQSPADQQLPQTDYLHTDATLSIEHYQMSTVEGSLLETAEETLDNVNDIHNTTNMEKPRADFLPTDTSPSSDNCPPSAASSLFTVTAASGDSFSPSTVSPSAIECSEEGQCSVQTPTSQQLPQADSLPTSNSLSIEHYQMSTVEGSPLETVEGTCSNVNDVHTSTNMELPGADYVPTMPPSADEERWTNMQSASNQQFPQTNYLLTTDSPSVEHFQMSTVEETLFETAEGTWSNVNDIHTRTNMEQPQAHYFPTDLSTSSEDCPPLTVMAPSVDEDTCMHSPTDQELSRANCLPTSVSASNESSHSPATKQSTLETAKGAWNSVINQTSFSQELTLTNHFPRDISPSDEHSCVSTDDLPALEPFESGRSTVQDHVTSPSMDEELFYPRAAVSPSNAVAAADSVTQTVEPSRRELGCVTPVIASTNKNLSNEMCSTSLPDLTNCHSTVSTGSVAAGGTMSSLTPTEQEQKNNLHTDEKESLSKKNCSFSLPDLSSSGLSATFVPGASNEVPSIKPPKRKQRSRLQMHLNSRLAPSRKARSVSVPNVKNSSSVNAVSAAGSKKSTIECPKLRWRRNVHAQSSNKQELPHPLCQSHRAPSYNLTRRISGSFGQINQYFVRICGIINDHLPKVKKN